MEREERQIHLLSLSYHDLQCLCKQHNLAANKSHSQLASSLASLLEKGNLNSAPGREILFGSTQASLATSSALLSNIKEASRCGQDNHKRGPYSDRDDGDRPLLHVKHQKGPQTPMDETLKSDSGTRMSFPTISIKNGKADCFSHSSCGQGIAQNVQSQNADGIAKKSTTPELARENRDSTANVNDTISLVASYPAPIARLGENVIDNGGGSSDKTSANATSFQFFVMSDEGLDLFVDLNSTTSSWVDSFKEEACIPPSTHHSETGNISNFISSLVSKDDHNTISPPGNIIVDKQNRGAEGIAPCINSSLGSTGGENSRSEPYPPYTTAVNSRSSASTLPGTLVEISGSQGGVPVVSSSCLTSDVQNNMSSDRMAGALNNKVLPQESVDVSLWSERSHAPLADDIIQPTGDKDTVSPGKTKVSVKIGCAQNVLVADTDKATAFSSGDVVKSDSGENSCPTSVGKQEMIDVPAGAQLTHDGDTHEVLMENEPVEAVPMKEDIGYGGRLSISSADVLPVKDAQSDGSSADRVAGNFDLTDPTPSSAASDNVINPLTSKHGAESAHSRDSADKKSLCDPEELEVLQHETQPASGEPTRNILLNLRSASARQTKPATLPRRSARLLPKKSCK